MYIIYLICLWNFLLYFRNINSITMQTFIWWFLRVMHSVLKKCIYKYIHNIQQMFSIKSFYLNTIISTFANWTSWFIDLPFLWLKKIKISRIHCLFFFWIMIQDPVEVCFEIMLVTCLKNRSFLGLKSSFWTRFVVITCICF